MLNSTAYPSRNPSGKATVPSLMAAERWVFVFMAALYIAVALTGFIPSSLGKLAAVEAGFRAPFSAFAHVHALLMGSWLILLLVQSGLVAVGRTQWHKQLGIVSLLLVPAMVVVGAMVATQGYRSLWDLAHAPPPGLELQLQQTLKGITNVVLGQIRVGISFPLLIGLALWYRKQDPATHKRLMVLATVFPLPAALDRITWLPTLLPESALATEAYTLLIIAPLLLWDLYRYRRLPRAWLTWTGVYLPGALATNLLWGTQWWAEMAPRLMGVAV